ncbi:MAG: nuclear transport factor 2 family protein [Myxococcota bacterium]
MSIANNVQAVIDGILSGAILDTFERHYAEDVVMSENRGDERVGKAANRKHEQAFVDGVEFHGAEVGHVLIAGDHAAIEWTFDMTPKGGQRVQQRQIAMQTWRDGQIIREDFYYSQG